MQCSDKGCIGGKYCLDIKAFIQEPCEQRADNQK